MPKDCELPTNNEKKQGALIPRCWLITPYDAAAWPNCIMPRRRNSHITNIFLSAVENVERTGRNLTEEDKRYLRLIISFWFGWSATAKSHMQDPGFEYVRFCYSSIKNLEPILDDMTYPEEARWMPRAVVLEETSAVFFASPDRFYIYTLECDALYDAGSTLKEVYEALRRTTIISTFIGSGLEQVEMDVEYLDPWDHFPEHDAFTRTLCQDILPFVPRVIDDSEYDSAVD